MVVFAHGSGSSKDSPRNQYVASILNNEFRIDTVLVDLLTEEEQEIDEKTREYRFNIKLLATRLSAVTDWLLTKNHQTWNANLSIGYFGASDLELTASAYCYSWFAENNDGNGGNGVVKAIVSRGGRPDLAHSSHLKRVQAPTLFLVGSRDNPQVIALSQKAFQH